MYKSLLVFALGAITLALPACSSKNEDPAAETKPELTAPNGGMVAYVNGVATTFTAPLADYDSDTNETRYYLSSDISATEVFTLRFKVPAGQPVPASRSQGIDLLINTGSATTPLTQTTGAGTGVLTVSPVAGSSSQRVFTGSFAGTVKGYKIEGGKFLNVLKR